MLCDHHSDIEANLDCTEKASMKDGGYELKEANYLARFILTIENHAADGLIVVRKNDHVSTI